MSHVVSPNMAAGVAEPVRELRRRRIQKQPRRLDGVACNSDGTSFLTLLIAILVNVDNARDFALGVVLNLDGLALGANFELARLFALGDLGDKRRPFRPGLASLKAETDLLARSPTVPRCGVDSHPSGMNFRITELFRAGFEHLKVVIAR